VDYGTNLTRPVETVNWYEATNYCAMRTQQGAGGGLIPTNYVYRFADGIGVGVCVPGGDDERVLLGRALRSGQANFDGQYEYDASVGTILTPTGFTSVKRRR